MAVSMARPHLGADRSVARVNALLDVFGLQGLGEARPSTATVELVERGKKGLAGDDVDVDAWLIMIPKRVLEGPFRGALLCNPKLFGRQPGYRLFVLAIFGTHTTNLLSWMMVPSRKSYSRGRVSLERFRAGSLRPSSTAVRSTRE